MDDTTEDQTEAVDAGADAAVEAADAGKRDPNRARKLARENAKLRKQLEAKSSAAAASGDPFAEPVIQRPPPEPTDGATADATSGATATTVETPSAPAVERLGEVGARFLCHQLWTAWDGQSGSIALSYLAKRGLTEERIAELYAHAQQAVRLTAGEKAQLEEQLVPVFAEWELSPKLILLMTIAGILIGKRTALNGVVMSPPGTLPPLDGTQAATVAAEERREIQQEAAIPTPRTPPAGAGWSALADA